MQNILYGHYLVRMKTIEVLAVNDARVGSLLISRRHAGIEGYYFNGQIHRGAARNVEYLKYLGVTHVLNAAEGIGFGQVSTTAEFYRPHGLCYKGLKLEDVASTDMRCQFDPASDFIEGALSQNGTFSAVPELCC